MPRVPLLSGTRLVVANAGDGDVVLRPPPPREALADGAAAVREALRFPLEGPPRAALARGFHGRVAVHDAEDPALVDVGPARVHPALVETELVVAVTAAETVLHGGAGALLAATEAETIAASSGGESLLETAGSEGWQAATALERALAQRRPCPVGGRIRPSRPRSAWVLRFGWGATRFRSRRGGRRSSCPASSATS